MDYSIQYLLQKVKAQLPSRLPLFVSLSRGASADGILNLSTDRTAPDFFRPVALPKILESSMRFKSILLTAATTGLTLHPISCYYPDLISVASATSPQLSNPSSSFILSTYVPGDVCTPMSHQKFSTAAKINATKHEGESTPEASKICALPSQRSSLPLEVAARRQAINVLEAMVGGLELGKWFLGVSSISSSNVQKGGSGCKVCWLCE